MPILAHLDQPRPMIATASRRWRSASSHLVCKGQRRHGVERKGPGSGAAWAVAFNRPLDSGRGCVVAAIERWTGLCFLES